MMANEITWVQNASPEPVGFIFIFKYAAIIPDTYSFITIVYTFFLSCL